MPDNDRWIEIFTKVHDYVKAYHLDDPIPVDELVCEMVTHPEVMEQPDYDVIYAFSILRTSSWDLPSAMMAVGFPDEEELGMYELTNEQRLWLYERYGHGDEARKKYFLEGDYDSGWDT